MQYIDASSLLTRFDAREIAQSATPVRYNVVDEALLALTISSGDRTAYTPEEIEAADAALVKINQAITEAGHEMDSYIKKRYPTLSLAQIADSPLPLHCANIARYLLMDDQEDDAVTSRYKRAIAWLKDLANGNATLGNAEPVKSSSSAAFFASTKRRFSRSLRRLF